MCTKDYKIPGTDVVIPKDLMIVVKPNEEGSFINPGEFDPDNFNESDGLNKFAFVGFGQGPRSGGIFGSNFEEQLLIMLQSHLFLIYNNSISLSNIDPCLRNCIGMRYAIQTLKLAVIHTVKNYNLVKAEDTTAEDKLFFSFSKNGFVGGIKFKVEKI